MWTKFFDMHSGGGCKQSPFEYIFIEAPKEEAEVIFYNRFGHNPNRVSCTCCGRDYSISEGDDLKGLCSFYIKHREYDSLESFLNSNEVLTITDDEINPDERKGELPEQGYVWVD